MSNSSSDFHDKLYAYFEDEIKWLTQLDIPENEVIGLVSEQFALIFDRLFDCPQEISDHTGKDAVNCMVQSLWIMLRTHMHMEVVFIKHGLKFDPTVLASFTWFLTR